MSYQFFDSHCHLDFDDFDNLDQVIESACRAGVTRVLIPSVSEANWEQVLTLSKRHSFGSLQIYAALGVHPWWANDADNTTLARLDEKLRRHSVVALGEIGLDGNKPNIEWQQELFQQQLQMAKNHGLPVTVHSVKAHNQVLQGLKGAPEVSGVIHGFTGSWQQAKDFLDIGFYLGVGGSISYQRARKTRKAFEKAPVDRLVLETDAPAMPLHGSQGQVNTPAKIADVFEQLCQLKPHLEPTGLAQQLFQSTQELFVRE